MLGIYDPTTLTTVVILALISDYWFIVLGVFVLLVYGVKRFVKRRRARREQSEPETLSSVS